MDVIDGITLQFMANMNHYQKYLKKNEASQAAFRDLAFYKERFLSLTLSLCDERTLSSSNTKDPLEKTDADKGPPDEQSSSLSPPVGMVASKVNDMYPIPEQEERQERTSSNKQEKRADTPADVHQDVHDAFNRFVDASVAYFQFRDRSAQLQQEYDGIPEPDDVQGPERANEAQPFDVHGYQVQQLVHDSQINKKTCVLEAFVAKGKHARSNAHRSVAKKMHNAKPSKANGELENDDGLL